MSLVFDGTPIPSGSSNTTESHNPNINFEIRVDLPVAQKNFYICDSSPNTSTNNVILNKRHKKYRHARISSYPRLSKRKPLDILYWKSDDNDPSVAEYGMNLHNYNKELEDKFIIRDYMPGHETMTPQHRAFLVSWMFDMHSSLNLIQDILYLSIKIVDTFFANVSDFDKDLLPLIGATAILVATKYEHMNPPPIRRFMQLCNSIFTKDEFIEMEANLLNKCNYALGFPLSCNFLTTYATCIGATDAVRNLASFILDCSLMNYESTLIKDSRLAAAALVLASNQLKQSTSQIKMLIGYRKDDLIEASRKLNENLHMINVVVAQVNTPFTVFRKYNTKELSFAATVPLIEDDDIKI